MPQNCPACFKVITGLTEAAAERLLLAHVRAEHPAIYDHLGTFYDALLTGVHAAHTGEVVGMLFRLTPKAMLSGDWMVHCVDLCCGTGLVTSRIAGTESASMWTITGVDQSEVQLAVAAGRLDKVIHGDSTNTGLPAGSADLVTCIYGWTDLDDWDALVAEAHRLLAVGGSFIAIGAHPAFVGPDVVRRDSGEVVVSAQRYLRTRHTFSGPGFTPGGLRQRVGAWHRSQQRLIQPLLDGEGWRMSGFREAGGDPPRLLGFRAERTA